MGSLIDIAQTGRVDFKPSAGFSRHVRPNTGLTNEWLTPRWIIEALGPFDLDPCASDPRPFNCARVNWSVDDDGLSRTWFGLVWMNPPYGRSVGVWLDRLATYGCGIALVFARTDTAAMSEAIGRSSGQLWLSGRPTFLRPSGAAGRANSGAPVVFLAFGSYAWLRLKESSLRGSRTVLAG